MREETAIEENNTNVSFMFLAPTIAVNGEQEIFVKKWLRPWKNEQRRRAETKRPY